MLDSVRRNFLVFAVVNANGNQIGAFGDKRGNIKAERIVTADGVGAGFLAVDEDFCRLHRSLKLKQDRFVGDIGEFDGFAVPTDASSVLIKSI